MPDDAVVPEQGAYLWDFWFQVLEWTETSRVGQDGCMRVTAPEWETYARMLCVDLCRYEWSIVFALDARYCGLRNDHMIEQQQPPGTPS